MTELTDISREKLVLAEEGHMEECPPSWKFGKKDNQLFAVCKLCGQHFDITDYEAI